MIKHRIQGIQVAIRFILIPLWLLIFIIYLPIWCIQISLYYFSLTDYGERYMIVLDRIMKILKI